MPFASGSVLRSGFRSVMQDLAPHQFVLIGGDVVHMSRDCGAPANAGSVKRAEIVVAKPPPAAQLLFRCPIERIEADPKAVGMGPLHQGTQPIHFLGSPFSRFSLSAGLDHVPRIIPPAPIVAELLIVNDFRRA